MPLKHAKPIKRRTVKTKRAKAETAVKTSVRADCVERDGHCRLSSESWEQHPDDYHDDDLNDTCEGPSEWMHLGSKKRARTLGMAPELRHTTVGSMMGCRKHHRDYDAGRLFISAVSDAGADGPLEFRVKA